MDEYTKAWMRLHGHYAEQKSEKRTYCMISFIQVLKQETLIYGDKNQNSE